MFKVSVPKIFSLLLALFLIAAPVFASNALAIEPPLVPDQRPNLSALVIAQTGPILLISNAEPAGDWILRHEVLVGAFTLWTLPGGNDLVAITVTLFGDDKITIYRWRVANPKAQDGYDKYAAFADGPIYKDTGEVSINTVSLAERKVKVSITTEENGQEKRIERIFAIKKPAK